MQVGVFRQATTVVENPQTVLIFKCKTGEKCFNFWWPKRGRVLLTQASSPRVNTQLYEWRLESWPRWVWTPLEGTGEEMSRISTVLWIETEGSSVSLRGSVGPSWGGQGDSRASTHGKGNSLRWFLRRKCQKSTFGNSILKAEIADVYFVWFLKYAG